jgi:hypothetical protein
MARPKTTALTYFPFNVDFFEDDKIQLIEAEFGIKGVFIAIKLLCKIYKENGYFYQWGDDQCLLFAKNAGNGIVSNLVQEVIQGLIKRSFFDKEMYDSFKILTSKAIQNRFIKALERSKNIEIIKEYACKGVEMPVNVTLISVNVTLMPQIKEDKIKEENNTPLPPTGDVCEFYPFEEFWNDYEKKRGDFEKLKTKWKAVSKSDREKIKIYLPKYKAAQPDKQYRKDPSTFLNQKSWNDEIIAPKGFKNDYSFENDKQKKESLKQLFK